MNIFKQWVMALMLIVSVPFFKASASEVISNNILQGQWRVSKVNFHSSPADKQNKFTSYHMQQGIVRYDFKANNEFSFVVPNKKNNRPEDGRYWLWNKEGHDGFSINQISLNSPPFNFGLTAKITQVDSYNTYSVITLEVVFHADQQTATMTLTNLNDVNWDNPPVIYVNNIAL
ncbi:MULTISPECIES: hypothetical protein [Myroides]|uniref:hypothetical protein n=1 Tax=Myroides TaxID=76831 RepID=UPI00132CAAE8|nr:MULTISPECIES: hypothetical protein [Myroides]MVX37194.1 hypothetical protein [Myroides sp. LoEW2-1]UVD79181.1 hypothetical protein NWE55_13770 [Myroides albus]